MGVGRTGSTEQVTNSRHAAEHESETSATLVVTGALLVITKKLLAENESEKCSPGKVQAPRPLLCPLFLWR